jgi:hypothetical protein
MSDTKLTESEIAAMQTEEIKALKAQLARRTRNWQRRTRNWKMLLPTTSKST